MVEYLNSYIITTSFNPTVKQVKRALEIAGETGKLYVEREKYSLKKLFFMYNVDKAIIVSKNKISCYHNSGEFFFHPDKSKLRIKQIDTGKNDQMIEAMNVCAGDTVLDCTLGLATDAIVASYMVGDQGKVVGIEKSPIIAVLTKIGLNNYNDKNKQLTEFMQRIEVVHGDCEQYLDNAKPGSFDVVYFDPMFRSPVNNMQHPLDSLRPLAEKKPLDKSIINKALKVAKNRVVMKESRRSKEFGRLGANVITGGKYSPIAYGVWRKEKVFTNG
ncbi:MAG: class I SAM-dependent methyltransferase [Clostridiales bacterium]|nr:class I SAM-dependent methyltransferase [Clostridiales bacterium]MCF8023268.1 class I SAM-dependent methyltransferase [Clostridiales bacterium]